MFKLFHIADLTIGSSVYLIFPLLIPYYPHSACVAKNVDD
jgi:hypothetical protein